MKKTKISSLLLTAVLAIQTLASGVLAADTVSASVETKAGYIHTIPSVSESVPSDNLMLFSVFNSAAALNSGLVTSNGPSVAFVSDSNGGYIRVANISQSHLGAKVDAGNEVPAGKYLFTGYFRTLRKGELTQLRIIMRQMNGEYKIAYAFPTSDEWLKVE
ncbi:MAG: hypothetical protein IJY93_02975 [Clostridia bacterium]|nr:hypothetical protein [Clostridia bacterium]